jgi:hypothetical protein
MRIDTTCHWIAVVFPFGCNFAFTANLLGRVARLNMLLFVADDLSYCDIELARK